MSQCSKNTEMLFSNYFFLLRYKHFAVLSGKRVVVLHAVAMGLNMFCTCYFLLHWSLDLAKKSQKVSVNVPTTILAGVYFMQWSGVFGEILDIFNTRSTRSETTLLSALCKVVFMERDVGFVYYFHQNKMYCVICKKHSADARKMKQHLLLVQQLVD